MGGRRSREEVDYGRRVGEDNQKRHCRLCLLIDNNSTQHVGFMVSTTTCVQQRSKRGIGDHHCSKTEWAVVVYGLDHNGGKGEGKEAEDDTN